ncbi:D-alanyl-D-alanine carboxypeptidase [Oceanobacillus caeni]|uniref:D-alanyl-D-alanine carboxypeptidase family protein n=1 Tax=Bacillaceae TaxID=186817 RepID=UPI00069988FB|nr:MULTISPECIES: D-alanyl-D-alanine carboxypeptidase family protein [Bacillaceae]PZD87001.1 D-alanyl-D-alanine carboxypeptidase [Bacilli bacterium]MBU8790889.1 D-alanyl-D-alanine carboxypeptidase [Oceanobacillus caeni]MCR1834456.1 D-alanyl-D-alanine carboxypeptidase [Oceanobacillus caeni]MED4473345.1 D-alanyl-D-alanine carboxypeptidase [Oceanobacillus caeni]PZD88446.1 D-alanyl-D-alanine carboxypeptidase [Bacilli bacterium]
MFKHHKKIISLFFLLTVSLGILTYHPNNIKAEASLDIDAEAAILVDFDTGKILYAKNENVLLPPASMTKMMTEYLVMEAIKEGKISWDTTTQISDYAYAISANTSLSGVGLVQNKQYTVKDLYQAMAINSDNATTIALAELVGGSETEFVKMMNQKAKELGLESKFVNASGLDNKDLEGNQPEGTSVEDLNLLTARSTAILAYNLIKDFPEVLEIASIPKTTFDGQEIDNWNRMLPHEGVNFKQFYYEGVDGLKTGFTDSGGYNFTGTAVRNGQRLISVVMKSESEAQRFQQTSKLLDYGYNNFTAQELFPKGYQLKGQTEVPVSKGKEKNVEVSLAEGITVPVKGDDAENYTLKYELDKSKLNEDGELIAPIEKGEVIGTAKLVYKGDNDYGYITDDQGSVPIVTDQAVEKANWFMLTIGAIGDFFANIFSSAVDWIKGLF